MTTEQAARRLNVSTESVRKMLASGRLVSAGKVGRLHLIDSDSVHRHQESPPRSGRIWTQRTAWAALCMLSGITTDWLSSSEQWRLRKRIGALTAAELPQLARRRASARRFQAGEAAISMLRKSLALTGASLLSDPQIAADFSLAAGVGALDGYARDGFIDTHTRRLGLQEDPQGNITVRETGFVRGLAEGQVPIAAVAVDLYDTGSARERAAALTKLDELLHGW